MTLRHGFASTLIALLPMCAFAGSPPNLPLEPYTFTSFAGDTVETEMGTLVVPYDRDNADSETIED